MEATVKILNQSPLAIHEYTDEKTGEKKKNEVVSFKLTDGTDTFIGEITGEKAVSCPQYDPIYLYRVKCSMVVRKWKSKNTGQELQATTIYIDKINPV